MSASPRRALIATRIAVVTLVGVVAFMFLSSTVFPGAVVLAAAVAVLVDSSMLARVDRARRSSPNELDTPDQITVDLNRRS